MSKKILHSARRRGSSRSVAGRILRTSLAAGFLLGTGTIATSVSSETGPSEVQAALATSVVLTPLVETSPRKLQPRLRASAPAGHEGRAARLAARKLPSIKSPRHWSEVFDKPDGSFASDTALHQRFDMVVQKASLSRDKLVDAFETAGMTIADTAEAVAMIDPAASRFGVAASMTGGLAGMALAYADPSPINNALSALSTVAPDDEGGLSIEDGETADVIPPTENDDNGEGESALTPDYDPTPDSTPRPLGRPGGKAEVKPDRAEAAEPAAKPDREDKQAAEDAKKKKDAERPAKTLLALARPNDPSMEKSNGGLGKAFNNLFNKPKFGNGVAVYDISAARVYMPDGTTLEAHSGIGKMADNPRYVHIKMNGPTPPHTYNLKMREKRFHGVEAIRMLPVDGKNKHGRDGFLTHSYLLRGGRAESHGCVAFKDYKKFLTAFKKGHIKQLVVVGSGGRAIAARGGKSKPTIQVATNGRGA